MRPALAAVVVLAGASLFPATSAATPVQSGPDWEVTPRLVGLVELEAPSVRSFVLRATLPIPPKLFPRPDGKVPFQVTDPFGQTWHTQVETVTRYPSRTLGSDVVEILSRIDLPESVRPGERLRFEVIHRPFQPAPFTSPPAVEDLLRTPHAIRVRARDAFGHVYVADLTADLQGMGTAATPLRDGEFARGARTHEVLLPEQAVDGPQGTLPHLMGVHAYLTRWAREELLSLDLRIHNGLCGLDPADPSDDALDKVYFESVEILVPPGWRLLSGLDDPYFGGDYVEGGYRVFPIVAPIGGGRLHVIPRQGQFERRFVVYRAGYREAARSLLLEENLAFCVPGKRADGTDLASWFGRGTARYFPQNWPLPTLEHLGLDTVRAQLAGELAVRSAQVVSGSSAHWPVESPGLGWAHPWLVAYGGMHGGTEISMHDGVATAATASQDGYRMLQLRHRMYTDRQPNVLYRADGGPTTVYDWLSDGPYGTYVPVLMVGTPLFWLTDPFGFNEAPMFQIAAVAARGDGPEWEDALLAYQPIDPEHLVRYTRGAMALMWLGNDALAKDDIRHQAEIFRFEYHPWANDYWGYLQPTGMAHARKSVTDFPGEGFYIGRAQGWGIQTFTAAYAMADDAWRDQAFPWFEELLGILEAGQMHCTGILQSQHFPHQFGGQYRCQQAIEAAIIDNALYGVRTTVYRGADPSLVDRLDRVLEASVRATIGPVVWSDEHHGPWALMAVSQHVDGAQPFCSWIPGDGHFPYANNSLLWTSLAFAYDVTGDAVFLQKAAEALGGQGTLLERLESGGAENLENVAAMLALAQHL